MKLYPYQEDGVDFLVRTRRALLADEMGLGKTAQAITALQRTSRRSILVVCPKTPKSVWHDEFKKWWPGIEVVDVGGTVRQRARLWATPAQVHLVNYEALHRDINEIHQRWDAVVVDESHRAKNRRSQTYQALARITRHTPYVFLLTGTPIMRAPQDLWAQLKLLQPTRTPGYWSFVRQYCDVYWSGYTWTVGELLDAPGLSAYLTPLVLHRTKELLGDQLPPLTVQQIWLDLPPAHRKLYQRMHRELFMRTGPGPEDYIAALTIGARTTFLRLAATHPSLVSARYVDPLTGPKVGACFDIIQDRTDRGVVIFSAFSRVIRRVTSALIQNGIPCETLHKDLPSAARMELIRRFQSGDLRVLLSTVALGGVGLTLTSADLVVALDKDWVPANNDQAYSRLHRIGQTRPVTAVELLARDTIDERIHELCLGRTAEARAALRSTNTTHRYLQG